MSYLIMSVDDESPSQNLCGHVFAVYFNWGCMRKCIGGQEGIHSAQLLGVEPCVLNLPDWGSANLPQGCKAVGEI